MRLSGLSSPLRCKLQRKPHPNTFSLMVVKWLMQLQPSHRHAHGPEGATPTTHDRPRDHLPAKSQQTSKHVLVARSDPMPTSQSNHHTWLGQTWLPDPVTMGRREKHLDQVRQIRAEPQSLGESNPHHQPRKKQNQAAAALPVWEKWRGAFKETIRCPRQQF